jgi:hypothetical protein
VLLWRFHGADGGGRCFPSYEKIATAAKCCRDTVNVAIGALEDAGLLTWVHRLTRIRWREQDLFGHWGSVWQVVRSSNAYQFLDPLDREPGRWAWCKSENPAGPRNPDLTTDGARHDGAQVIPGEPPRAPPVRAESSAVALQREQAAENGGPLSDAERAALVGRLTTTRPRPIGLYGRDLEARLASCAI